MNLARSFRVCVRTASGSDRIIKFRGILRIPSLPLRVLTHSLNAWASRKKLTCLQHYRTNCNQAQFWKFFNSLLELQPNSGAHHCVAGKVHVRIVVHLPKPFWTVVVGANSDGANESAGIFMS